MYLLTQNYITKLLCAIRSKILCHRVLGTNQNTEENFTMLDNAVIYEFILVFCSTFKLNNLNRI